MKFNFKVPSISKKREELNFDHSHVLTQNFGIPQIVSVLDIIPNTDITVDLSAFTRLTPLPCPTYGGVKMTHRAYFVPFEFCLKGFNDFVALQKVSSIVPSDEQAPQYLLSHLKIPYFTVEDIFKVLLNTSDIHNIETLDSPYVESTVDDAFDFSINRYNEGASDDYVYVKLTSKGRRLVTWLAQLGYKLPPTTVNDNQLNKKYDCLALFAYWKFYLDWVVPSRFVLSEPRFLYIKSVLDTLEPATNEYHLTFLGDSPSYTDLDLEYFLMVPTSFLDDDHYTTSFVTPYGIENSGSDLTSTFIRGLDYEGSDLSSNSVYSPDDLSVPANAGEVTQIGLLSLGRLQQLVNKKKITNTNVLDFLRSSFGIAPSHDVMRLSTYFESFDSQIMVGDVMATATTETQMGTTVVGQYAGKGLGGSSAKWRVHSDMHGILFITSEISTKSSYVNGVSPLRSRFQPLDFFHDLFDNVGVRAVRHDELVMNTFESYDPEAIGALPLPSPDSIFGFQPRYSEYKFHDDMVSGDFMFPSVNKGMDSWYLNRKFKITDDPKIGLEFISATSDSVGSQYDRIFQNTNNIDHFYSVYYLNVHETSIKEKLFDYFKTLNDTDVDKDLQDVTIN